MEDIDACFYGKQVLHFILKSVLLCVLLSRWKIGIVLTTIRFRNTGSCYYKWCFKYKPPL